MSTSGYCSSNSVEGQQCWRSPPKDKQLSSRSRSDYTPASVLTASTIHHAGADHPQLSSLGHWMNVPWALWSLWEQSSLLSMEKARPEGITFTWEEGSSGTPRRGDCRRSKAKLPQSRTNSVTVKAYLKTMLEMFCDHPFTSKVPSSISAPSVVLALPRGSDSSSKANVTLQPTSRLPHRKYNRRWCRRLHRTRSSALGQSQVSSSPAALTCTRESSQVQSQ